METKYIPAVVGDTMISALKFTSDKWTENDIAFDTREEAIQWLKDKGHEDKKVV